MAHPLSSGFKIFPAAAGSSTIRFKVSRLSARDKKAAYEFRKDGVAVGAKHEYTAYFEDPAVGGTQRSGTRGGFETTSRKPHRRLLPVIYRTFFQCLLILSVFLTGIILPARAGDRPFNMPANWGGTGLMEIPTARILGDGEMRMGYAGASPYNWYTLGIGVIPGLEFSARYTEISNISSGLGSDYGSYKDKAFDVKYQLVPESRALPAVALGLQDFSGTRLFKGEYLTLSRQIYPLDFTFGFGHNRLRGPATLPFWENIGIFGGIEWTVNDRLQFMLEYNPIQYEKDPDVISAVPEGAKSPINAGLRFKLFQNFTIGASYQRGDTFGFSGHLQFALGEPILPQKPDPPSWGFVYGRNDDKTDEELLNSAHQAIKAMGGFKGVKVYMDGERLSAEFENKKYLSNAKAAGRVLRILLYYSPPETSHLTVIFKRRDIHIMEIAVPSAPLRQYLMGELREDIFSEIVTIHTLEPGELTGRDIAASAGDTETITYDYGIKPSLETYFNDPAGAFQSRFTLDPYATAFFQTGTALHGSYSIPLYSDVESENDPISDAVRSDAWLYMGTEANVDRLMADQVIHLSERFFGRISAGYLERMYAGVSSELLYFIGSGSTAVGVNADWVRKREPGNTLALTDFDTHTLLGNLYYRYDPLDITFHTQYGRFLAGDIGFRFEVSRRYDTGAYFGFWYSETDTHDLTGFNRNYNDKGIFVRVPIRMFFNTASRTIFDYSIAPWTRDVGGTLYHWQDLYDLASDLMPPQIKKEIPELPE